MAAMAQALIAGRIDCRTAGRLVVQLQTMSKLLWMSHCKGCQGSKKQVSPQICTDTRRSIPSERLLKDRLLEEPMLRRASERHAERDGPRMEAKKREVL